MDKAIHVSLMQKTTCQIAPLQQSGFPAQGELRRVVQQPAFIAVRAGARK
jgi:hypothetical protein